MSSNLAKILNLILIGYQQSGKKYILQRRFYQFLTLLLKFNFLDCLKFSKTKILIVHRENRRINDLKNYCTIEKEIFKLTSESKDNDLKIRKIIGMKQTLRFFQKIGRSSKMLYISLTRTTIMNMNLGERDGLLTTLGLCIKVDLDHMKQGK